MATEKRELTKQDIREALDAYPQAMGMWRFALKTPESIKELECYATPKQKTPSLTSRMTHLFYADEPTEKDALLINEHGQTPRINTLTSKELIAVISILLEIEFDSALTGISNTASRCFDSRRLLLMALGNDAENKMSCLEQLKRCNRFDDNNISTVVTASFFSKTPGEKLKKICDRGESITQYGLDELLTPTPVTNQ